MSLESADPHDSDVLREKIALFVVCDVTIFINRIHVPRQIYFCNKYFFMILADEQRKIMSEIYIGCP